MKKKTIILIIFTLVLFVIPSFAKAKEMTLDELGAKIDSKYDNKVSSAYIIGEYVYTSRHSLSLQDIMLSSRSIQVEDINGKIDSDAIFNEMSIIGIKKSFADSDEGKWVTSSNLVGKTSLDEKINVKYIDYEIVKEDTNIKVDVNPSNFKNEYKEALKSMGFEVDTAYEGLSLDGNKLTGHILKNTKVGNDVFQGKKLTGYYFAYVLSVTNDNFNEYKDKVKVTLKTGLDDERIFGISSFDDQSKGEIVVLVSINSKDIAANKVHKITVDLDGDENKYGETSLSIDYSKLTYQADSLALVYANNISEADKESLRNLWGYDTDLIDKYEISQVGNKISLTGEIYEQILKEGTFSANEKTKGYFFVFNVEPQILNDKISVKIPSGSDKYNTFGIDKFSDGKSLNVIFKLDEQCVLEKKSCSFNIIVDYDGNENKYFENVYTIDYSGITLKKIADVNLENNLKITESQNKSMLDVLKDSTFEYKLDEKQNSQLKVKFSKSDGIINVDGFIPIVKNVKGFSTEETTDLYLPFVINVGNDVNVNLESNPEYNVEVTLPCTTGDKCINNKKVITRDAFDTNNELVVLKSINYDDDKTFDITIDLDGAKGSLYNPETITVNYSNLVLQKDSSASLSLETFNEEDTTNFNSWGYNIPLADDYKLSFEDNTYNLKGKILETKISEKAFKKEEQTGFYFAFNISDFKINDTVDKDITVKIAGVKEKDIEYEKLKDGDEAVLFAIDPSTLDDCSSDKCTVKVTVDLDGSKDEYNPVTYYVDYSNVTLVKESKTTVEKPSKNDLETYGYETQNTYNIDVSDESTYKVTGYINKQKINDNVFSNDEQYDYYLGFKFKLKEVTEDMLITVNKASNSSTKYLTYSDLTQSEINNKEINALRLVDMETDDSKVIEITVDLDGCKGSELNECKTHTESSSKFEYEPYKLKIDYTELTTLEDYVLNTYNNTKSVENATWKNEMTLNTKLEGYKDITRKIKTVFDQKQHFFLIDTKNGSDNSKIAEYQYNPGDMSTTFIDYSNTFEGTIDEVTKYGDEWKYEAIDGYRSFLDSETLLGRSGIGIAAKFEKAEDVTDLGESDTRKIKITISSSDANNWFNSVNTSIRICAEGQQPNDKGVCPTLGSKFEKEPSTALVKTWKPLNDSNIEATIYIKDNYIVKVEIDLDSTAFEENEDKTVTKYKLISELSKFNETVVTDPRK